jgi:hypothetical protein
VENVIESVFSKINILVSNEAAAAIAVKVADYLQHNDTVAISIHSHLENAWLKTNDRVPISYEFILELSRVF